MKKIGLMTWFSYDNFGSLLQCKATMKTVKKLGYEIELINYLPKTAYKKYDTYLSLSRKAIKKVIKKLINKPENKKLNTSNMQLFRENLKKSDVVNTKSELFLLNNIYDAFICGSDQIWAPTCYDENYFLSFVKEDYKKIAYAPSLGLPVIENNFVKENMKNLISKFYHLSTREEQGTKIIKDLTGKKAEVVLDPTLLLTRYEWEEDIVDVKYSNYILAYFLGENKKYYLESQRIAKLLNRELLIIPTNIKDLSKKECLLDDLGPKEFLSLIDKADMILTDSFHGTIFSINFHKPLIVFKRFIDNNLSQNSRIYNILEKLSLKELIFSNNSEKIIKFNKNINYAEIDKKLSDLRNDSLNFLKNSLKKATEYDNPKEKIIITNNCTGCGVCSEICPQNCISIEKNKFGFYEYRIDYLKCVSCGACLKVCGQANKIKTYKVEEYNLYSAFSTDKDILMGSTSGGICTTIAYDEIENNKHVIGCQYNYEKNEAVLNMATDKEEFEKMRGSKYIQANPNKVYKNLKNIDGGVVIGTPCQIASVDLYLKILKKRENFVLVDFICHGVPSYKLWEKYIEKYKNIKNVLFRNKKSGWRKKYIYIKNGDKNYIFEEEKDLFYHFFTVGNVYNDCCYECKYRDSSMADIRVGDYWGPKFKDNTTGVSMVIPFTEIGKSKIKNLEKKNLLKIAKENVDDYFKYQQSSNFRKPLEYYEIIGELSKENISLQSIDKKYNSKILLISKIFKIKSKLVSILGKNKL